LFNKNEDATDESVLIWLGIGNSKKSCTRLQIFGISNVFFNFDFKCMQLSKSQSFDNVTHRNLFGTIIMQLHVITFMCNKMFIRLLLQFLKISDFKMNWDLRISKSCTPLRHDLKLCNWQERFFTIDCNCDRILENQS